MTDDGMDRRDFLKSAAATFALLVTSQGLSSAQVPNKKTVSKGPAVHIGVIGLGQWGKEIVSTLSKLQSVQVTAICDTYENYITRASKIVPKANTYTDHRHLLESSNVDAVVISTPTHQHKEIVLDAIQANKHVYCEAPLANSIEDARAIAQAGSKSRSVFQVGLQGRSNMLYNHVCRFVKSGCLGVVAEVHSQWNKRQSWRRAAPNPEREKELNWRLSNATSLGLVGESGIHSLDLTNRYLKALPISITGFGSIMGWNDGRDVPDTIQCVFEYPNNVRMVFSSTLVSSFSNTYTLFQGSESSLMMKENRSWMVKEADSSLLGWEVYAHKENVYDETGICMIADATKLIQAGKEPGKDGPVEPTKVPLLVALENFVKSIHDGSKPAAGALEGYQSTVSAIKANEAVVSEKKVVFESGLFDLK